MSKLLSIDEVRALWPDPKPTEKALKRLAKSTGCCRKLGRAIGFTEADVNALLASCSSSTETRKARTGTSVAPSPDAAYAKAQALMTEARRKRSVEKGIQSSTALLHLASNALLRGAKR